MNPPKQLRIEPPKVNHAKLARPVPCAWELSPASFTVRIRARKVKL